MKRVLVAGLLWGFGLAPAVWAQQVPLTPAQTATLRYERTKAEEDYVGKVAKIAKVRERTVRQAMPDRRRITDPVARTIAALEVRLGEPLSDAQKEAIRVADAEYMAALKAAEQKVMGR